MRERPTPAELVVRAATAEAERRYEDHADLPLTAGAVRNARQDAFVRGASWQAARTARQVDAVEIADALPRRRAPRTGWRDLGDPPTIDELAELYVQHVVADAEANQMTVKAEGLVAIRAAFDRALAERDQVVRAQVLRQFAAHDLHDLTPHCDMGDHYYHSGLDAAQHEAVLYAQMIEDAHA